MTSLPTDNLYKFCAIAGLIIMGFSVYYPLSLLRTLHADLIDISTDLDVLHAETEFWDRRSKRLNGLIKNSVERKQTRKDPDPSEFSLGYSDQEIKGMIDEFERLDRDQKITLVKVKGNHKKSENLIGEVGTLRFVFPISITIGFMLSTWGFVAWYIRVQRPLDEKLKETGSKAGTKPDPAGDD